MTEVVAVFALLVMGEGVEATFAMFVLAEIGRAGCSSFGVGGVATFDFFDASDFFTTVDGVFSLDTIKISTPKVSRPRVMMPPASSCDIESYSFNPLYNSNTF